jgi:hypothetical protein
VDELQAREAAGADVRLTFTIPGPPVPKARARVVSRVDASGKRKTRGITPKRTEAYEEHVRAMAWQARLAFDNKVAIAEMRGEPVDINIGGVQLAGHIGPAIAPKPWPFESKEARFGLTVRVFHGGHEGDWDNYGKAVSDACNGVLWADDKQVIDGRVVKERAERGRERIEVEVCAL